jgi:hypothetical protein
MPALDWPHIITVAREIVESYDTPVTLRQLYYQLVSRLLMPNSQNACKRLSALTAELRRNGEFPELSDAGREIHRHACWGSPGELLEAAVEHYRRDRTSGQDVSLYLGVEKRGIVAQLDAWFSDDLGIPVVPLGGYSSESYEREIQRDAEASGRPTVVIYAGDFDPSGEDILRNFTEQMVRRGLNLTIDRIALTAKQVNQYRLPEMPGKETDSRANGCRTKHGKLVQVELDALDPNILRGLYQAGIDRYWAMSAYKSLLVTERAERQRLRELCAAFKAGKVRGC